MPRNFDEALQAERDRMVAALQEMDDPPDVGLLTEEECLLDFAVEFRRKWEVLGEARAVAAAGQHVFDYYASEHTKAVLAAFWPTLASALDRLEVDFTKAWSMLPKLTQSVDEPSAPAVDWLLTEAIPRAAGIRQRLALCEVENLGKLVRLVQERLLVLSIARDAGPDEDDWAYDNFDVMLERLERLGLVPERREAVLTKWIMEHVAGQRERGDDSAGRRAPAANWKYRPVRVAPNTGELALAS